MKKIKEHNPVERKIKTDIILKNTLRKQLQKDISFVMKWAAQVKKANNNKVIAINNFQQKEPLSKRVVQGGIWVFALRITNRGLGFIRTIMLLAQERCILHCLRLCHLINRCGCM